jgi:hypothetical protein
MSYILSGVKTSGNNAGQKPGAAGRVMSGKEDVLVARRQNKIF